jgi:hypothetical protein
MQANLFFRIPFGVTQSDVFYAITGYNIACINFIEIKLGKFENFAHVYLGEWNPAQYHMFNSLTNPSGSTLKLYMPWGKPDISELRLVNNQRSRSAATGGIPRSNRVDEFGRDNDMRMRHHLSNISVKRVHDEHIGGQSLLNTNHLPPNVTDNRRQRKPVNAKMSGRKAVGDRENSGERSSKEFGHYHTPTNKPRQQTQNAPQKAAKQERLSPENIASMQEMFRFANEQIDRECNMPINLPIAPTLTMELNDHEQASLPIAPTLSHVVSEPSENTVDELCDAVSELTIDDNMRDLDEHDTRRTKYMDIDAPCDLPPNLNYSAVMPVRRRVIRVNKK